MPELRICDDCPLVETEEGGTCGCRLSIDQEFGRLEVLSRMYVDKSYHTYSTVCAVELIHNGMDFMPKKIDAEILAAPDPDIHKQFRDPELTKHFDAKLREESLQQDVFNRLPSGITLVTAQFGIHEDPC